MDLDLVKSEILQDVFRAGMPAPLPASERKIPSAHTPETWPEQILAGAREAESATTVKSSLPKVFNPLLRKQNVVNRALIASARAGADGLTEAQSDLIRLEEEMEVLRRAANAAGILRDISTTERQSLRRSSQSNSAIVEFPWVLRQTTRLPVGATVLVCGCAGSLLNLELASLGFQVIGVDQRACRDDHPNFSFLEADPASPPLPDGSVDAVIAVSWLGQGNSEQADLAALQQWRRMLRPGGALIFTLPFGQPSPTSAQKVNNAASLSTLLGGWKVEAKEFARCTTQSAWVCPVSETEAAVAVVTPSGRPQGLVLVFARA